MRYLLTGAGGFVGSHMVRHLLANTDAELVLPVSYAHRGDPTRLKVTCQDHPEWWERIHVMHHDLRSPFSHTEIREIGEIDTIYNLAAQSHVDRSITEPVPFIRNNLDVALAVFELARAIQPRLVVQFSTDEVYGPADKDEHPNGHPEWSPIIPSNPYSASKAAQEAVAVAYWRTYGMPVVISNTMNIIGEMQNVEKFVPMTIRRLQRGLPVTAHVAPDGTPGSRFYLHARNASDALMFITNNEPDLYPATNQPTRVNIVGDREINNIEMIEMIAAILGVTPTIKPVAFHASRPGHDLRYGLDGTKLARMGWVAPVDFEESLERTVRWTLARPEWLLSEDPDTEGEMDA